MGMFRSSLSKTRSRRGCLMAVSMALWLVALGPVAAQPWAADVARAQTALAHGDSLFEAQNYDAALHEFVRAYAWLAGDAHQNRLLNNIAVCHERMFRYELAVEYYQRYLSEGGARVADRATVETIVRTLSALLGRLQIESNVMADVWIDERRLGRSPGSWLVPAGRHTLELRAPVHDAIRRELTVTARQSQHLALQLRPLSQYRGLRPAYFWCGAVLTVAALGAGSALGVAALSADRRGRERERENPFLNTQANEQGVRHTALAADVAFAGATLVGVSTVILFFLTDWTSEERAHVTATVGAHSLAWQLSGRL
jgi:tetratricopeptide (TPR) repeat protein